MQHLRKQDLGQLYESEKDRLWSFLAALSGNRTDADDLLQQVFLRLVAAVESREVRRDTARGYLYRMARNAYTDAKRSREAAIRRELAEFSNRNSAPLEAGPRIDRGNRISALRQCVECLIDETPSEDMCVNPLTPLQRSILRYRLYSELSAAEIAQTLQVSRRTLYRELQRAMVYLREEINQAGFAMEEG